MNCDPKDNKWARTGTYYKIILFHEFLDTTRKVKKHPLPELSLHKHE
jgi:hypothetical protein